MRVCYNPGMAWSLREEAERLRREAEAATARAQSIREEGGDHSAQLADMEEGRARDATRDADQIDTLLEHGTPPDPPAEDAPADNPAEQIGEAAEAVEEAAAETAEAIAEAGDPELAQAVEFDVLGHLEAVVEHLRLAQETVEAAAEGAEVATPPDTPEGNQAEEAVETAEVADDAVTEAETAVREVARDAVHPSAEHPYYRERSVFRRGRRTKEQT